MLKQSHELNNKFFCYIWRRIYLIPVQFICAPFEISLSVLSILIPCCCVSYFLSYSGLSQALGEDSHCEFVKGLEQACLHPVRAHSVLFVICSLRQRASCQRSWIPASTARCYHPGVWLCMEGCAPWPPTPGRSCIKMSFPAGIYTSDSVHNQLMFLYGISCHNCFIDHVESLSCSY